jgi:3-oxoacyl-[acyl-carrier-protein] synthase II
MSEGVVITGIGAVSPLGWGVDALREGLFAGRSALGPVTRFDAAGFRSNLGGEVPPRSDEDTKATAGDTTLAERYLLAAVREALSDSLAPGEGTALVVGTNFGGMPAAERALAGEGAPDLSRYEFRDQADRVAREAGLTGVTVAMSLSCASGTATVVEALGLVRSGRAERVVAAGYDELSLYAFAGLSALRAISPDGMRPFDRSRNGTVFSEGAGAVVVESAESARARNAKVYVSLLGGALNNDGYHMTAPEKEARGIRALMTAALADAGVEPAEIDHVNLHGTGTKYNDLIETKAIKAVFGPRARAIPVTANKGTLGHAMGAAGSLETVAAVLSIRDGKIPPTLGLEEPDPECDLDVVTGSAREAAIGTVLKTSYGIGGANAAVVLGAPKGEAGMGERTAGKVEREELRGALGKKARAEIIASIKTEILRRFALAHPDVKVRFLTGPYVDPDAPRGTRGRKR